MIEIYHPEIGRHRIQLFSSARRRESPDEPDETTEEMATHLQIGHPGETDDLVVHSPKVGFGVDTPNERIDIDGAIAMKEGTAPTATTAYGKVYVNDADGHLYFIDEAGNITDLTVDANAIQSVSSSANTTGRTEHMRFIPGSGTDITESATDDTIFIQYSVDVTSGGVAPCSSPPAAPALMEGATTVCTGEPGASYAVPPVDGASFYRWTVPADAVISSGMGTNSVNVIFGSTDGNVCAKAFNDCGESANTCIAVSINRPTSPGSITGTSPVCPGQTGVSYYIASVPGATNYIWTLPPGAVLASGTGTPNITVNFGTSGGDICVQTENSCGTSTPQCMSVVMTATPTIPGAITGSTDVCEYETGVTYSISSVAEATSYSWTLPSGSSITAGDDTETITVTFGATSGNICVTASSICGTSSPRCLAVTVTNPPAAPSSISGASSVVPGTADEGYSISPVTGATDYLWTISGDASIDGSTSGTSISVDFGSTSGSSVEICVNASNSCGTSSWTCKTVTIADPASWFTNNTSWTQNNSTYRSTCHGPSFSPTVTLNGSTSDYYLSLSGNITNQWIVYDFGTSRTLSRFRQYNHNSYGHSGGIIPRNCRFQVGSSVTGPWTDVAVWENPALTGWQESPSFSPTTSRYWRFYMTDRWGTSGGEYILVAEVGFYGY